MTKIDTSTWKEFQLSSIIEQMYICKSLDFGKLSEGKTAFVNRSAFNNGIQGYVEVEPYEQKNCITVGMVSNSKHAFWQEVDFVASQNILVLRNKKWSKNIGLFICSLINNYLKDKCEYNEILKKDTFDNVKVLLPIKEIEEPDWAYMENYIKDIEKRVSVSLTALQEVRVNTKSINVKEWKSFYLYDIFDIDSGSKLDKVKMDISEPKINFVGRSNFNNGITEKVNEIEGLKPYDKGNLTLALGGAYLGSCFVQKEMFYTSQNVVVLKPKNNISDNAKQFIATAIFKESQNNYKAFINELNRHIKTDFQIKLPVKSDGSPDYCYMDKYIESVYGGATNVLKVLTTLIN